LREKIDALAAEVEDMENTIFNIHVPPYGTGLDEAPEIDSDGHRRRGGTVMASVGSSAVRSAILEYQPLLSLHGHIHESTAAQRLGRTVCINPGSTYQDWNLQGVVVDVESHAIAQYVLTTG
jgi:Icc-related predicted phosphoesterase